LGWYVCIGAIDGVISRSGRYDRRPEGDVDAVTTAAKAATSADDAFVRRARSGEAAAFEVLVDTRIDRCYRLRLIDPGDVFFQLTDNAAAGATCYGDSGGANLHRFDGT
jgi:hypothetical protein